MNWKTHAPLALATAAIMAALVACTWSINRHIDGIDPGLTENSERLHDMNVNLAHIEENTAAIDKHLLMFQPSLR